MSLDLNKLENVQHLNNSTAARCPACAQEGRDNKGNHLFIASNGRFGCVLYPGIDGAEHRKTIFDLAGEKKFVEKQPIFVINKANRVEPKVLVKDILGHLGRQNLTHSQNSAPKRTEPLEIDVPSVPICEGKGDQIAKSETT